jgi:very-short-patch-repair endonuclease
MKNKHTDKTILKDKVVNETLETQQWTVLRFWEHEIKSNIIGVGNRIEDGLKHAVIIT